MLDAMTMQSGPGSGRPNVMEPPAEATVLRDAILAKLTNHIGKRRAVATDRDWLVATALAVRDMAVDRWLASIDTAYQQGEKRVY